MDPSLIVQRSRRPCPLPQGADDSTTTSCGGQKKKKLTAERRTAHEKILYVKRISTGEQCFEDLEKQVMPLSCKNDLP